MTNRQAIDQLLQDLRDEQLEEVLEFARIVVWPEQREPWQRFRRAQFAKAYGDGEPDYSAQAIQPEAKA